jgi:hypothetical protein
MIRCDFDYKEMNVDEEKLLSWLRERERLMGLGLFNEDEPLKLDIDGDND